nr:hypothetical protein [Antarctobacter heliothermus]
MGTNMQLFNQGPGSGKERPVTDHVQMRRGQISSSYRKGEDRGQRGLFFDEASYRDDLSYVTMSFLEISRIYSAGRHMELFARAAHLCQSLGDKAGGGNDTCDLREQGVVVPSPTGLSGQTGCIVTVKVDKKANIGPIGGMHQLAAHGTEFRKTMGDFLPFKEGPDAPFLSPSQGPLHVNAPLKPQGVPQALRKAARRGVGVDIRKDRHTKRFRTCSILADQNRGGGKDGERVRPNKGL